MKRIIPLILVLCMLLSACASVAQPQVMEPQEDIPVVNQPAADRPVTNLVSGQPATPKAGTYNPGVVLVKVDGELTPDMLAKTDVVSAEPLYEGAQWYLLTLAESADTVETVEYLRQLGCFDAVDYDYVMSVGADTSYADVSENPDYSKQETYFATHQIYEGWEYLAENGYNPGGSPDVVIAIIDTGVDYNHEDLRNNIWINAGEIPDNGIDDDGNGYVDDIYGWNFVGDNNAPLDDNGHGTHVAGIVAAENNSIGGVGIAYNCKIMVLKAGNANGKFINSNITRAIQYAYMNGASVINMSFGGASIAGATQEALENAQSSCVLVAAAGNDTECNNLNCEEQACLEQRAVMYPAALPYVIGVMSCDQTGMNVSPFSNYDHYPYDTEEYELFACGDSVFSTWPHNKYTTLKGTSMAAPVVSAIAALLRSYYADRELYPIKFINAQLVSTGTAHPQNTELGNQDANHPIVNVYEAMTRTPTPATNLHDYYIDDSVTLSEKNNGNGIADAGETIRLYISMYNRGGVAGDVKVTIDTLRSDGKTDPYFNIVNDAITLSDIGTYSVRKAYVDEYFEIVISLDCPNDYLGKFNIRCTYTNGLNEADTTQYSVADEAEVYVARGYYLPSVITEDTVYTADRLYLVADNVIISKDATVTFEEGCEIQFYEAGDSYRDPQIIVYGTLNFRGSDEKMICISPHENHYWKWCAITVQLGGYMFMEYTQYTNCKIIDENYRDNSYKDVDHSLVINSWLFRGEPRPPQYNRANWLELEVGAIKNCYIDLEHGTCMAAVIASNFIVADPELGKIDPKRNNSSDELDRNSAIVESNIVCTYPTNGNSTSSGMDAAYAKRFENNLFRSADDTDPSSLMEFRNVGSQEWIGNAFSEGYQKYAGQIIENYYDSTGTPIIDVYGSLADASVLWPYIVSIEMFDADGNPITRVGKEEITVRVTFNRPMDTTQDTFLTFGTIEPYADYRINGAYVSDTVWEGTYTLKTQIENGQNYLMVNNACAAEDQTKIVFGKYYIYEFTIDTTSAMSMSLQAVATDEGINLTWFQDDYDTLLGYNIYRSEKKDGNYVKLNPTILLASDESFLDENAEPGKTYWYTYTVVLSDFTESKPAGRVACTAWDTIAPRVYHTPVNQGYEKNNLVISCTASDNIAISTVTLYYRAAGETAWKRLNMSKQNDKYSATIFGSDVTMAGLEYYIVAIDGGGNEVQKGSAETPYTVVVKDASAISRLGDVDGDGTVTTKDALMIMQTINGDLILADDAFQRADLNKDGILSSMEALRILQYINGNVTTLEM